MFKALLKKRNGNKGFTLIELIVVIAILAILALLLVPRFAGFTDSAKVRADASSAKTIQTAITTMLATGKLEPATGNLTVSDGAVVTNGPTNPFTTTESAIQTELQKLIGTDLKKQTSPAAFTVTVTNGEVKVAP